MRSKKRHTTYFKQGIKLNYATPNQGLASFFVTQGQKVIEVSKRKSKFDGESYFFVFDTSVEDGRNIATDFYEKRGTVEPFAYWEAMKELRAALRDTRAKETN